MIQRLGDSRVGDVFSVFSSSGVGSLAPLFNKVYLSIEVYNLEFSFVP